MPVALGFVPLRAKVSYESQRHFSRVVGSRLPPRQGWGSTASARAPRTTREPQASRGQPFVLFFNRHSVPRGAPWLDVKCQVGQVPAEDQEAWSLGHWAGSPGFADSGCVTCHITAPPRALTSTLVKWAGSLALRIRGPGCSPVGRVREGHQRAPPRHR